MCVMKLKTLQTARLSLRLAEIRDRRNLIALEQDPEVMRFVNGGRDTPADGHADDAAFLTPRGGESEVWVAFEKATDVFVGWFSLRRSSDGAAELGYRLCRSAWSRGFGSEGARALVEMGFAELRVQRIFATTMAVNRASCRVMEKAGLTYVRTFHFNWPDPLPGSDQGDVEYEMTRDRWQYA
jgi:RimJ/RimL family protein N-acetyltransferase